MLPMVTMLGLQVGTLLGGSVLVETVFAWPGIGRLAFEAVMSRDLNLLLGILLICSVIVVVANILVDLTYAWLCLLYTSAKGAAAARMRCHNAWSGLLQ